MPMNTTFRSRSVTLIQLCSSTTVVGASGVAMPASNYLESQFQYLFGGDIATLAVVCSGAASG